MKISGKTLISFSLIVFIINFFTLANYNFTGSQSLHSVANIIAVICFCIFVSGFILMILRKTKGERGSPLPGAKLKKDHDNSNPCFPCLRVSKLLLAVGIFVWLLIIFPFIALTRVGVFDQSSFSTLGEAIGSIVIGAFAILPAYVLPPLGLLVIPLFICGLYLFFSRKQRLLLNIPVIVIAGASFIGMLFLNGKMNS
jgi:hypothetical protein